MVALFVVLAITAVDGIAFGVELSRGNIGKIYEELTEHEATPVLISVK